MVAAMVIGGVASIGSAVVSSSASTKAANAAKDAAAQNNALQQDIYNQNKANLSGYTESGNKATSSIDALLGNGGDQAAQDAAFQKFLGSTGYQFQTDQGEKAVTAALGSKGLLDSGAALKSLNNYGQQQALTGFGTYASLLQGQQSTGLSAASALAGVGQQYADAVGTNNTNAANTVGNAALASAGQISSALGNLVTGYGIEKGLSSSYKPKNGGN